MMTITPDALEIDWSVFKMAFERDLYNDSAVP